LLAVILEIGNYLNQGAKPFVSSFNIDFLVKLSGIRSTSKSSLLEYIVIELAESDLLQAVI
jgi:hypothetical protein